MQSIYWTGRLLSRTIWNGISNYTACADPNVNKRREASFISAVCGFPKDFTRGRIRKGQFGDDAWFSAKFKTVEVIGNVTLPDPWKNSSIVATRCPVFAHD